MDLKNKLVIVTGASKGIGLALVKRLLDEGAKVAAWSRSSIDVSHDSLYYTKCDVSDGHEVAKAFEKSVDYFGIKPDVLINNAGLGYFGSFQDISFEDWKRMFDVNVHGIFHCSQAVIPSMVAKEAGHIVNIGSVAGRNPVKNMVGYAGTKHAVTGISHSMFMELREFGIKVTCIYPGSVQTNFFDEIEAIEAHENMMQPQDVAESIIHCLKTPPNYLPVDFEVRPLKPKG